MRALPAWLMIVWCVGAAAADPDFTRQGPAATDGSVQVLNAAGKVEILAWDRPEFLVRAHTDGGVERVEVMQEGRRTIVRVVPKKGFAFSRDARIEVRVPSRSDVNVVTASASISVTGVAGIAQLQSASGEVAVADPRGAMTIHSVSGGIHVAGSAAPITVHLDTLSGGIFVRDLSGELHADSIAGGIYVTMSLADRIAVHANVGRAQVDARLSAKAEVDIESFAGAVQAKLSAEDGYHFEASSVRTGAVHTCFAGGGQNGSFGAGGAHVRLRSFGGAVSLCDH
jgi:hypothetical protein